MAHSAESSQLIPTLAAFFIGLCNDIARNLASISGMFIGITIPFLFLCWCRGRIASKMGDSFFLGLIPYLNDFLMYNRLRPRSIGAILYPVCCAGSVYIPVIGAVLMIPAQLILRAVLYRRLAGAFGYGFLFSVGLYVLTPLFMAILAFGHRAYSFDPRAEHRQYAQTTAYGHSSENIRQIPW